MKTPRTLSDLYTLSGQGLLSPELLWVDDGGVAHLSKTCELAERKGGGAIRAKYKDGLTGTCDCLSDWRKAHEAAANLLLDSFNHYLHAEDGDGHKHTALHSLRGRPGVEAALGYLIQDMGLISLPVTVEEFMVLVAFGYSIGMTAQSYSLN